MNFREFLAKYQHTEVKEYPNEVTELPLVTVCVQTYQHEKYIKECLDGILMQKTSFAVEILIGEDDSRDGTRQICIEYAKKHPHCIKLFLHDRQNNIQIEKNPTGRFNFLYNIFGARGKYVAICEGDDYWIDPYKLAKQVDYMEQFADVSLCFHAVQVKNEIPNYAYSYPKPIHDILSFADVLKQHYIATCSVIFKRSALGENIPTFFLKCLMADIPLQLLLADKGPFYYLKEEMAVYRKNPFSITNHKSQISNGRKSYIFLYQSLLGYFFPKHFFALLFKLSKTYLGYIKDFTFKFNP